MKNRNMIIAAVVFVIIAALSLYAVTSRADTLLPVPPQGPVVVQVQPNRAWGSPLPDTCRGTFNYTTGLVTIEPNPNPAPGQLPRGGCGVAWLENMTYFWRWFAAK